jgi:hypothetical protein
MILTTIQHLNTCIDNTGGEPPVTMAEMHASAWQQHQEMHS